MLGTATAVLLVLALGAPRLLSPAAAPVRSAPALMTHDGCPTTLGDAWAREDRPGRLVPTGALSVALCLVRTTTDRLLPPIAAPLVLDTGVEAVVEALNALPTRPRSQYCSYVRYAQKPVLVLSYRYRTPVVVQLDVNCRTAVTGDRVRSATPDPRDTFVAQYRARQIATRNQVPTVRPTCPVRIPASRLGDGPAAGTIDALRGSRDPLLPLPVTVVVACRYSVDEQGAALQQVAASTGGRRLRDAVNSSLHGIDRRAKVWCGIANDLQPTVFDALRLVDTAGGTTEVWVVREPCTATVVRGPAAIDTYGVLGGEGTTLHLPAPGALMAEVDGRWESAAVG
jgi:hypothetical protein